MLGLDFQRVLKVCSLQSEGSRLTLFRNETPNFHGFAAIYSPSQSRRTNSLTLPSPFHSERVARRATYGFPRSRHSARISSSSPVRRHPSLLAKKVFPQDFRAPIQSLGLRSPKLAGEVIQQLMHRRRNLDVRYRVGHRTNIPHFSWWIIWPCAVAHVEICSWGCRADMNVGNQSRIGGPQQRNRRGPSQARSSWTGFTGIVRATPA